MNSGLHRLTVLGHLRTSTYCIMHSRTFHALNSQERNCNVKREHGLLQCHSNPLCTTHRSFVWAEFYDTYLSAKSPPIGFAQSLLENVHDITGVPWWATIVLTTVTLRTAVTLPVAVYAMKNMEKVARLQPELYQLSMRLRAEVTRAVRQYKWDIKTAMYKYNSTMNKILRERYMRDNCHPAKSSLVVLTQLPLWVCMSFALRNMTGFVPLQGPASDIPCPDLAVEGLLWFTDLTLPDTTYMLPVLLGAINLALVEVNWYKVMNPTFGQIVVTNLFRGLSVLMIPIGASVPSCMCLYWTVSSLYGLAQNLALKRPEIRGLFGLSTTPLPTVPSVKTKSTEVQSTEVQSTEVQSTEVQSTEVRSVGVESTDVNGKEKRNGDRSVF